VRLSIGNVGCASVIRSINVYFNNKNQKKGNNNNNEKKNQGDDGAFDAAADVSQQSD